MCIEKSIIYAYLHNDVNKTNFLYMNHSLRSAGFADPAA